MVPATDSFALLFAPLLQAMNTDWKEEEEEEEEEGCTAGRTVAVRLPVSRGPGKVLDVAE